MKIIALAILLIAATAFAQNATTTASPTTSAPPAGPAYSIFAATLNNNQKTTSVATGVFIGFYDGVSKISYYIMHNVAGATNVTLHDNSSGDKDVPALFSASSAAPNTLITGTWNLQGMQIYNIFNNLQYIQVASPTFPNGEIRSTVSYTGADQAIKWVSFLNFQSTTSQSASNAVGLMTVSSNLNYLGFNLQHNVSDTVSSVVINGNATYCVVGNSTAVTLPVQSNKGSVVYVYGSATQNNFDQMNAGNYYVQINTATNADGDIRGQIQPVGFYTKTGAQGFNIMNCKATPIPTKSGSGSIIPGMIVFLIAAVTLLL